MSDVKRMLGLLKEIEDIIIDTVQVKWVSDLKESKMKKGGLNKRPITPRPAPPKGFEESWKDYEKRIQTRSHGEIE